MEDEQNRTIWCGNLNEKVSEDLLYELFLQGGPVEKVSIPKDRNGKQRAFAFITYKHKCSVLYALDLFDGTTLFNRPLSLKPRETTQSQQEAQIAFQNHLQNQQNINQMLQYGNQMLLGNFLPNMGMNMYNMYPNNSFMMPNQSNYYQKNMQNVPNMQNMPNLQTLPNMQNAPNIQNSVNVPNFQNEDRRNNRPHPYYNNRKEWDHDNRDRERENRDRDNRERNIRDRDNRDRETRDNDNNRERDDNDRDSRYNVRSHRNKHPSFYNSNKYNNRRNYR